LKRLEITIITFKENMKNIIISILITLLASCAAPTTRPVNVSEEQAKNEAEIQKKLVIKNQFKTHLHALKVGIPILMAGAKECGDNVRPLSGLVPAAWMTTEADYQDAFKALYGNEDEMKLFVVPDSFAEKAGFINNDSLLAINDISVTTGKEGLKKAIEDFNREAANDAKVEYTIRRDGKRQFISMVSPMACAYPISISTDDSLNAWADGKQIVLTKGMMRFAENDDELALVIGHELAHNNMGHISAKTKNWWMGTIFDVLIAGTTGIDTGNAFGKAAASSYSQEFESEADYVGLYFAARAGYNIEDAPNFWRRMAVEHPASIKNSYGATHPATPNRYIALGETTKEINRKNIAEEPLNFHMKPRKTTNQENTSGQPSIK
jgi:Zn-dependent protease with chaperone function